ncbi:TRM11 family SAM-dependent methyltransferase [Clostridium cochlearium]|uniref:Methyltransferase n=1 Tax=Clostridium cochlearium TaxID=1494 RepID=A0A240A5J3_CLOCO|nr:DNA methyltransferase [Clostridium cochlearium]MBV1820815.1 methyltransferase domain-containing protein [Bacteroidales bacterium MSK.15.36]NSJ92220.1 methyltransferase domain-containing protein [Coprococcus sp. MSK.21.13]MCG4570803.1 methyltransferase domain-containing protein [Clostridium cochlearium]MCG4581183.1 methyltransferase domain-containing protein [Clostridium cochlearium]MCR1970517.1 DNA methyltransferase [Clostridium cochlearium]
MDKGYRLEYTTVWDFENRGSWASHKGDYPGNWSPYVPRNLILKYSKEKDLILDQFCGSGTTLIEASLLNRRAIGCDINERAINTSNNRLNSVNKENIILLNRDARNLYDIKDNSIDLICTHPPYANIIKYSNNIKNDLSLLNILEFYKSMEKVANECYRVLKDKKYCAILMGDTRKNGCIIPLGFNIMNIFMNSGFKIKEIIIKKQNNCKSTEYWKKICIEKNFYLIAHEYLFVFIKNL